MEKNSRVIWVFGILLILIFSNAVSSFGLIVHQKKSKNLEQIIHVNVNSDNTIYVDDDNNYGPWDGSISNPYKTIWEAEENAKEGDTIYVFNGEYIGFTTYKKLHFIGESNENTKIKVWWANYKIELRADSITFTNFYIYGRKIGWRSAHLDAMGNNIVISNCKFVTNNDISIHAGGEYWYTGDLHKYNITITDCIFQDSGYAVYLYLAQNCVVKNCIFNNNYHGVYLIDLSSVHGYHNVYNCEFYDNNYGARIYNNYYNSITNCNFHHNSMAIYIDKTEYNHVTSSTITNNDIAIYSFYGDKNEIMGNKIINNKEGIKFDKYSDNNRVHHNNFDNNINYHSNDEGNSFWDDGLEGNYWDDYAGDDYNDDGIGDSPYRGKGNSIDYYPLINPYLLDEQIPSKPIIEGITTGKQWAEYEFSALSIDPNFDSIYYKFDWDDGRISEWNGPYTYNMKGVEKHKWYYSGTFNVKVKAKDINGGESDWSESFTVNIESNTRPQPPVLINPPSEGIVAYSISFEVKSTDYENEKIKYYFHWGDPKVDEPDDWTGLYDSGEEVTISNIWGDWYNKIETQETFNIMFKARDQHEADSDWSSYEITIKNNAPLKPIIWEAPEKIKVGESFSIRVSSADPDNHQIAYIVEYEGAGLLITNIFIDSWENYTLDSNKGGYHDTPGTFTIKIKAYDYYGAEGDWAEHTLIVEKKGKNKLINPLIRYPLLNLIYNMTIVFFNRNIKKLFTSIDLQ